MRGSNHEVSPSLEWFSRTWGSHLHFNNRENAKDVLDAKSEDDMVPKMSKEQCFPLMGLI